MDLLIQHNLVEQKHCTKRHKTRVVYAITERGLTVLKYFRELKALTTTEDTQKIPALLY